MGERRSIFIIVCSIALVLGLVLAWVLATSEQDRVAVSPLTQVTAAATIQDQIQLSRLGIATSENFAGQKIRVIAASMKNVSDRPIRMAEVRMVFTDFDGKPVHEYSEKVLQPKEKPLTPGGEFRFEIRVENLPRTWNYRVPITEVTRLGY